MPPPSTFFLPKPSLDFDNPCAYDQTTPTCDDRDDSPSSSNGSSQTVFRDIKSGNGGRGRADGSTTPVGEEELDDRFITAEPETVEASYSPTTAETPELLPPENFAMVSSFLYRSSFPAPENFPFLKTLGLKSVLTLVLEDYPQENLDFFEAEGIKFFQVGIPGNKSPVAQIPDEKIVAALSIVFDVRNHPMLIHCNKGKHRTGCLVGCLRKAQQWPVEAITDEYRRYSFPKSRSVDAAYIEAFNRLPEVWETINHDHLPPWLSPTEKHDEPLSCESPIAPAYHDRSKKLKIAKVETTLEVNGGESLQRNAVELEDQVIGTKGGESCHRRKEGEEEGEVVVVGEKEVSLGLPRLAEVVPAATGANS